MLAVVGEEAAANALSLGEAGVCGVWDGVLGRPTCAPHRRGRPPRLSRRVKTRGCCYGRLAACPLHLAPLDLAK